MGIYSSVDTARCYHCTLWFASPERRLLGRWIRPMDSAIRPVDMACKYGLWIRWIRWIQPVDTAHGYSLQCLESGYRGSWRLPMCSRIDWRVASVSPRAVIAVGGPPGAARAPLRLRSPLDLGHNGACRWGWCWCAVNFFEGQASLR